MSDSIGKSTGINKIDFEPVIQIRADLVSKLNFAMYQNAVPVLNELLVHNGLNAPLSNIKLRLVGNGFFREKVWNIQYIEQGHDFRIPRDQLDIKLDRSFLGRLTESEITDFHLQLINEIGESVTDQEYSMRLLACNQWGGMEVLPEIIAAFIQPNDPAVNSVIKKAAEALVEHGTKTAMVGYKAGRKGAWEQASAIWSAVASLRLDYAQPPAGFETSGQKIRTPKQVVDSGLGTCLDISLFFCSILEQTNLHPVLVFRNGHALPGVWLIDDMYPDVMVDDIASVRKRIQLNELVLFESTLITGSSGTRFDAAVRRGREQVSEASQDSFLCLIDVSRARNRRILPLASDSSGSTSPILEGNAPTITVVYSEAPDDLTETEEKSRNDLDRDETDTPESRLQKWQKKLLDLSLRNRLLNFKPTIKAIQFEAPDPTFIEDKLADGNALKIRPREAVMDGSQNDPRSMELYEGRTHEEVRSNLALEALTKNVLLTCQTDSSEIQNSLVQLFRSARQSMQEGGANTLFLAIGFLSWSEHKRNSRTQHKCKAPLILIPVTLNRRSVRSDFELRLHDDEARFNPTLIEMLRQDFGLVLPITSDELQLDEHGIDVKGIWNRVGQAIKDQLGWEISEEVYLSTFSFSKYLMWKDLVDRTSLLKQNPVVKHLIDTPKEPYHSDISFPSRETLDDDVAPEELFCPMEADSYQVTAVLAASHGKDYVLIGPPGTGKSQTITNIIAQSLALGKSVLFVSEKIAALNVVYSRLKKVGLGDFCLELHSNKANKKDVYLKLDSAWEQKGHFSTVEWTREAKRLKTLRDQLNGFVRQLHIVRKNGMTAFQAIGLILAGKNLPTVTFPWLTLDTHSEEDLDQLKSQVETLDILAREVGSFADSPLKLVDHDYWSPQWARTLVACAAELLDATKMLIEYSKDLTDQLDLLNTQLTSKTRRMLNGLAGVLPGSEGMSYQILVQPDAVELCDQLSGGIILLKQFNRLHDSLNPWTDDEIIAARMILGLFEKRNDLITQLSVPYVENGRLLDVDKLVDQMEAIKSSNAILGHIRLQSLHSKLNRAACGGKPVSYERDLSLLYEIHSIDRQLLSWDLGHTLIEGLWKGPETDISCFKAFLSHKEAVLAFCDRQARDIETDMVAFEKCGTTVLKEHLILLDMYKVDRKINDLGELEIKAHGLWNGINSDVKKLEQALSFHETLANILNDTDLSSVDSEGLLSALFRLLGHSTQLGVGQPFSRACVTYRAQYDKFAQAMEKFSTTANTTPDLVYSHTTDQPDRLITLCQQLVHLEPKYQRWCIWRNQRNQVIQSGLLPLVDAVEHGIVAVGTLAGVFRYNYARWWMDLLVEQVEELRTFSSSIQEKRISDFCDGDNRYKKLTSQYIQARLRANLPHQDDVRMNSEWGILNREIKKKKRQKPIREIIELIPNAIGHLAPCMMMSPLSIAQYLSADSALFDLVIFDEASQIPVWDAIGAIARGRQVIMVGDQKQLPPSTFFDRSESDEEISIDDISDQESILDECLAASIQSWPLSWHYRSRHESLIAFSNYRYYKNGLITFPSPETDDRAVRLRYVADGQYGKGTDRRNRREANALVAELITRLRQHMVDPFPPSIGVVTFNMEQQDLIEELLESEVRRSPGLEKFFSDDIVEPIIVKNLESIQGDERDIMFFSTTYGPDLQGRVSMNFGPMNKEGGERRLNVAVTRARQELIVYSSLHAEDIVLSRTQSEGVRDLKLFLEYADRGIRALTEEIKGPMGEYESPFESVVAESLQKKGWIVHPQVGVSSFRIDLGIVDPDHLGRYLAGVECDGATYHRSCTAKDRDILREMVLKNLGWNILRVWSTDWWHDPEGETERLHLQIEIILKQTKETPTVASPANTSRPQDDSDIEVEVEFGAGGLDSSPNVTEEEEPVHSTVLRSVHPIIAATKETILPDSEIHKHKISFAPYTVYKSGVQQDPKEATIEQAANGLLQIVQVEGPVMASRVFQIYLHDCGFKRMGKDLEAALVKALQYAINKKIILYCDELNDRDIKKYILRTLDQESISPRARADRDLYEIPPNEVMVAARLAIMKHGCTKGSEDQKRMILQLFELKRLTGTADAYLQRIVSLESKLVDDWIAEHRTSK